MGLSSSTKRERKSRERKNEKIMKESKRRLPTMNNPNNRMRMAVQQLTMGGRCGFNRRKPNNRITASHWWLQQVQIKLRCFRREPQDPWRG
jgi:hypothetical protein